MCRKECKCAEKITDLGKEIQKYRSFIDELSGKVMQHFVRIFER